MRAIKVNVISVAVVGAVPCITSEPWLKLRPAAAVGVDVNENSYSVTAKEKGGIVI